MYDVWASLRDSLSDIACVESCKIGVESNISPEDYPMIRIVPIRITAGLPYNRRTAECVIYFGVNTTESEGLELVYSNLMDIEGEIIKTIKANDGKYIETVTDEDRLDTYKLMLIRFEIEADRPTVV
jgi:hypothetical protein